MSSSKDQAGEFGVDAKLHCYKIHHMIHAGPKGNYPMNKKKNEWL